MHSTSQNAAPSLPQFVRDLLASPPRRGEGLNLWFYRVARVLHPFRSSTEIEQLLAGATNGQPVRHGEIERAVKRSAATAWQPGQPVSPTLFPIWPSVNVEQREAIIATGFGLVDLWEISPIRFENNASHTEEIVDQLFSENPLLCAGAAPHDCRTARRDKWRAGLSSLPLIVPSPMTASTGRNQSGAVSTRCLDNTHTRRFLVVEFDTGTIDDHAALLLHLAERAPLALAVFSGAKSLHGWFYCAGVAEKKVYRFFRYAVSLGADRATWTRCQLVRMPDGTRNDGNKQIVFFFNPAVIRSAQDRWP